MRRFSTQIRKIKGKPTQVFALTPSEMALKIYDLEKRIEALEKENTCLSLLGPRRWTS